MKKRVVIHRVRVGASLLAGVGIGLLVAAPASAQIGGERASGVIVDIRGDILQIRPHFTNKLSRVVLDKNTQIQSMQMLPFSKLQPGMRLFGFGDYLDKGGIQPRVLMVVESAGGFFGGKMRGVQANGYGKSAMFGGKLKTTQPFVVVDDDGKDVPVTIGGFMPVMRMGTSGREVLLVGREIEASGERTNDGLLHAKTIQMQQGPGGGGDGSLFGEVVSSSDKVLVMRQRLSPDTLEVYPDEKVVVQLQITIDPDTVKVGDTLTVQGRRIDGSASAPKTALAAVLLTGSQTYPKVQPGGFFAMFRGTPPPDLTRTGKVASLSPFVLTLDDGTSLTVIIPGQTPVVDLRPITLAEAKAGERLMVIGGERKEGGLLAKTIIIGASPIAGFGG